MIGNSVRRREQTESETVLINLTGLERTVYPFFGLLLPQIAFDGLLEGDIIG